MTIDDLLQNRISPFDTDDEKLRKLFIYFAYEAPTLKTAGLLLPKDVSVSKTASAKATSAPKSTVNATSSDAGHAESGEAVLQERWDSFITVFDNGVNPCKLYAPNHQKLTDDYDKKGLGNSCTLSRRFKGYVCKRENAKETDYACVLRHLRNAIAHMNVFMVNMGNRKFILFEDFNLRGFPTARLLFTQSDLNKLKKAMGRYQRRGD
ncbi:MAG: hypothetical protein LIO99_14020 [Clostridiales bacterium]|nr:hypothetical protein [Clostridiales bacterium]